MRSAALVLGACLCAAGCGDAPYRGSWEVVGYKRPAVSVLGDLEAQALLGATLDVTASTAAAAGDTCVIGHRARQTLTVRNLEMAYNVMPGELGIPHETVEVVDLECSTGRIAFGQQLIRVGRDSLLTPWEGMFLLLEKRGS